MDKGDKQGSSALDTGARKWQRNRRLLAVAFFMMAFMFGGVSATVYAVDCTKDTVIDQFGDWFGNLGKPARTKNRNIAVRKANRLADCTEKKAHEVARVI